MPTPVENLLKDSAFVIGYNAKGESIGVVEGEGYTIIERSDGPGNTDQIGKVKEHLKLTEPGTENFPIEVKITKVLHIGSKSCHIIYLSSGGSRIVCG